MIKLLIPLALTGAVLTANAGAKPYEKTLSLQNKIIEQANTNFSAKAKARPKLNPGVKIGIARLDKGRLISPPFDEEAYWQHLGAHLPINMAILTAKEHIKILPGIPMDGRDSDNRIDEIRISAMAQGMEYVLIYAFGEDAKEGMFGQNKIFETGLVFDKNDNVLLKSASAKAVLVNSYSGEVLAAFITTDTLFPTGRIGIAAENFIGKHTKNPNKKT